jgi:nitrate/nitrite transporter NarK
VLAAIPYGIATATMLLIARRADRAPSRRPYLIVLAMVGAAGAALTAQARSPLLPMVAITLAAVGLLSAIPVFWALPTAFLSGTAAAAGIALIAAVGNLGGFAGPALTGVMEDSTGGFEVPLTVLAGLVVFGALLVFLAREEPASVPEPEFTLATETVGDTNRSDRNETVLE